MLKYKNVWIKKISQTLFDASNIARVTYRSQFDGDRSMLGIAS